MIGVLPGYMIARVASKSLARRRLLVCLVQRPADVGCRPGFGECVEDRRRLSRTACRVSCARPCEVRVSPILYGAPGPYGCLGCFETRKDILWAWTPKRLEKNLDGRRLL